MWSVELLCEIKGQNFGPQVWVRVRDANRHGQVERHFGSICVVRNPSLQKLPFAHSHQKIMGESLCRIVEPGGVGVACENLIREKSPPVIHVIRGLRSMGTDQNFRSEPPKLYVPTDAKNQYCYFIHSILFMFAIMYHLGLVLVCSRLILIINL